MANMSMADPGYWRLPDGFFSSNEDEISALGLRMSLHLLGPDEPSTGVCLVCQFEPGYIISRHCHPAFRFEIICRGTLEAEGRVFEAGDVMTADPDELYGPKVAGPDGCLTLEVFSSRDGAQVTWLELKDGSLRRGSPGRDELGEVYDWYLARSAEIRGDRDFWARRERGGYTGG